MKKTKSNNNELFTGIRRLGKLSDNKTQKKSSKKSSKKTIKRNKLDKETADMMKIINSESYAENKQNKQMFKDVDMSMVNDFVPVDDRGNIVVHNRIADLFGPVQQIANNIPQVSNNVMSEVDMDMFNSKMNIMSPMNQPSLEMQVQQLNNMMGMQNQMSMMGLQQNQMSMMGLQQNQMPMNMIQNQMPMGLQQNQMQLSPTMQLSPVNANMANMGNNLGNLASIYSIPKLN